MKLKKWCFLLNEYDRYDYVVFAETLEEALEIVNKEEFYGDDSQYYYTLDDYFDIEELQIYNPSKAYKGCYREEW